MHYIAPLFAAISAVLIVVSGPSYFLSTIRGQTRPHRMTWFIWSILGITALVSQFSLGATWSLAFTLLDSLGNVGMFALALRYGVGGWNRAEQLALSVAAIGIVASLLAHQAVPALIGVIVADAAGYWLTIRKAYLAPDSEAITTWLLIGASAACGVVAVGQFDLILWLYPAYLALASFGVVIAKVMGVRRTLRHDVAV